jgi:hypothetical protein
MVSGERQSRWWIEIIHEWEAVVKYCTLSTEYLGN